MATRSQHAPAERAEWEDLYAQILDLQSNVPLQTQVEERPEPILLLNTHRQIVYGNKAGRLSLGVEDPATMYGCRPGEVLNCIHVAEGEGGCGTSTHCRVCGAVTAVLNTLQGKPDIQRCSIQSSGAEAPLEFVLIAMPISFAEQNYVLVSMAQASDDSSSALAKQTFALQGIAAKIEG